MTSPTPPPPARVLPRRRPPGFVYRFDWREEPTVLGGDIGKMLGAAHAFEVPFVFGHFDLGPDGRARWTAANEPGRRALSQAIMSYWAAFARGGVPKAD